MYIYLYPVKIAILTFPFIAAIFTLPFLIFQYKKYGYINKIRVLIIYSFLLFLITSYYLIILPLPNIRSVSTMTKPLNEYMQLTPFAFIFDFLKETKIQWNHPNTYLRILKERALLQVIFNVILLMPLGIYLRYYFKKTLNKTILITVLFSLFFELTQLTGLYGIYPSPYRLFDVDDLILNTLGSIIGYLLAPKITYFLPNSNNLDMNIDFENMNVGFTRRFVSLIIDLTIILLIIIPLKDFYIMIFVCIFYHIIIPYKSNGFTPGKRIVKIKLKGNNENLTLKEILFRFSILYSPFAIHLILTSISPILTIMYDLALIVYILFKVIKNDKILFYEKISGTKNILVFKKNINK